MATKRELDRQATRKARLIQEIDFNRQALAAESENLKQVANLVEQGHGIYRIGQRLMTWAAPLNILRSRNHSAMQKVLSSCSLGLKFFRNWRKS